MGTLRIKFSFGSTLHCTKLPNSPATPSESSIWCVFVALLFVPCCFCCCCCCCCCCCFMVTRHALQHARRQATSPDGECIVTGAGDETLRFWNVFSKSQTRKVCALMLLEALLVLVVVVVVVVNVDVVVVVFLRSF